MEQQQTKLPLEWLSSRRCRSCIGWNSSAGRQPGSIAAPSADCRRWKRRWHPNRRSHALSSAAASGPTQLEQLSRKLNAANAELRRYETRMFAYERTMLALRKENAELTPGVRSCGASWTKYPPPRCGWMFRPHSPRSRSRRRLHRHRLLRTVNRKQSWNTSVTRSWPSFRS